MYGRTVRSCLENPGLHTVLTSAVKYYFLYSQYIEITIIKFLIRREGMHLRYVVLTACFKALDTIYNYLLTCLFVIMYTPSCNNVVIEKWKMKKGK